MSEAWPNRRYVVDGVTYQDREQSWNAARALSRDNGCAVSVEHFDEGEPTGQARFKNGLLMDTVGDAR